MATRLQIARKDILRTLDEHPSRVFRQRDIEAILEKNRNSWRLAQSTRRGAFIEYLTKSGKLKRLDFPFPFRKEIRYAWGEVPLHEALLTLKPDCHFSHYTAVQMHELTEQDPKTIYLNFEQPAKAAAAGRLEQGRIDLAFARKPRVTSNVARFGEVRICLLNGKNTGYLGIETLEIDTERGLRKLAVRVTDIERTLIDIAVRPFYAGGTGEVLKAYERAGSRASVNRLAALLSQLKYVYPYHQAVGFYLERSGAFNPSTIDLFRGKFAYEFDFYLTYEMKKTRYDARWRLHVPVGM